MRNGKWKGSAFDKIQKSPVSQHAGFVEDQL